MITSLLQRFTTWTILGLLFIIGLQYVLIKHYESEVNKAMSAVSICNNKLELQNSALLSFHEKAILDKKNYDALVKKATGQLKTDQKELTRLQSMKIPSDCEKAVKIGIQEGVKLNQ